MFIIMFLALFIVIYIKSFKEDFTEEHINKLKPAVYILISILVLICLLGLVGV